MRVLQLHNYYQQPGGEDVVVEQERALLASRGHEVRLFAVRNDGIAGTEARVQAALSAVYSWRSKRRVQEEIESFRPNIVHVHNFFPLLSPSVYYACRTAGIPVVQTLHNFRLICPNALLFRDSKPCELCVGKTVPWAAIRHSCYRQSKAGTAAVAAMLAVHGLGGTWSSAVDAFITLTNFSRDKLIAGKLPRERLFVKPHFLFPDPGRSSRTGDYALFVGRLSEEKGIQTLLSAWARIPKHQLKVAGSGPLESLAREMALGRNIEVLGHQSESAVRQLISSAAFVVFPSKCYEGFGRVIVESFAHGKPVVASGLGSMAELVDHGQTGLLFRPGAAESLADAVEWMFTHPAALEEMSQAARCEFETKYTAERNYEQLMGIYQYASQC